MVLVLQIIKLMNQSLRLLLLKWKCLHCRKSPRRRIPEFPVGLQGIGFGIVRMEKEAQDLVAVALAADEVAMVAESSPHSQGLQAKRPTGIRHIENMRGGRRAVGTVVAVHLPSIG